MPFGRFTFKPRNGELIEGDYGKYMIYDGIYVHAFLYAEELGVVNWDDEMPMDQAEIAFRKTLMYVSKWESIRNREYERIGSIVLQDLKNHSDVDSKLVTDDLKYPKVSKKDSGINSEGESNIAIYFQLHSEDDMDDDIRGYRSTKTGYGINRDRSMKHRDSEYFEFEGAYYNNIQSFNDWIINESDTKSKIADFVKGQLKGATRDIVVGTVVASASGVLLKTLDAIIKNQQAKSKAKSERRDKHAEKALKLLDKDFDELKKELRSAEVDYKKAVSAVRAVKDKKLKKVYQEQVDNNEEIIRLIKSQILSYDI
jgi:hypothetical protein